MLILQKNGMKWKRKSLLKSIRWMNGINNHMTFTNQRTMLMSVEADAHRLTFDEYKKKYGYKYINVWVAENEVDVPDMVDSGETDETDETEQDN